MARWRRAGGTAVTGPAGAAGLGAQWIWGDGSDGNFAVPAGTTTLTRDMYYNALTWPVGGGQIITDGYRLFALSVDFTNAPANAIIRSGTTIDGGNSAGAPGGSAGTGGTGARTTGESSSGTTGQAGAAGVGTQGTAATATNPGNGGPSGSNGAGGAGGAGAGGVVRGGTGPSNTDLPRTVELHGLRGNAAAGTLEMHSGGCGGPGGSSGAGDGVAATGGGGGGGGAGGAVIRCFFRAIVRGGTAPLIRARGGNGGNGGNSSAAGGATGGGGGGAGGGGGVVELYFESISGAAIVGGLSAPGGNGGNGGNGQNGGGNGNGGWGSSGGNVCKCQVSTDPPTWTYAAPGAGTANVGQVGGTGGASLIDL